MGRMGGAVFGDKRKALKSLASDWISALGSYSEPETLHQLHTSNLNPSALPYRPGFH